MRRNKQEITDKNEITEIINRAYTARIAINRDGAPYIVPMNFGYADETFYFHCAGEGLKMNLLKSDPRVCIEIDESSSLVKDSEEKPCSWGVTYRSVIASGAAEILTDFNEKKAALNIILSHFTDGEIPPMQDSAVSAVTVFRVKAEQLSAKRSN